MAYDSQLEHVFKLSLETLRCEMMGSSYYWGVSCGDVVTEAVSRGDGQQCVVVSLIETYEVEQQNLTGSLGWGWSCVAIP